MGSKPPPYRPPTDRMLQSRLQRWMCRLPPTTPSLYGVTSLWPARISAQATYGLLRTRTYGPLRFCPHLRLMSRELARAYQSAVQSKELVSELACSRFEQLRRLRLTTRHAPFLRACNPLLSVPLAVGNLDCKRHGHEWLLCLLSSCRMKHRSDHAERCNVRVQAAAKYYDAQFRDP